MRGWGSWEVCQCRRYEWSFVLTTVVIGEVVVVKVVVIAVLFFFFFFFFFFFIDIETTSILSRSFSSLLLNINVFPPCHSVPSNASPSPFFHLPPPFPYLVSTSLYRSGPLVPRCREWVPSTQWPTSLPCGCVLMCVYMYMLVSLFTCVHRHPHRSLARARHNKITSQFLTQSAIKRRNTWINECSSGEPKCVLTNLLPWRTTAKTTCIARGDKYFLGSSREKHVHKIYN